MRNSIYTFDNDTNSFYPFIRQFSNYQDIRNSINIDDPSSITSYAWANYPSFQQYLHDYSMNGCWVFNKEKRTYHWDSTVKAKADKLTQPYEYVGPSINDVNIHYGNSINMLSLVKKPAFGDALHAPWPGELLQDDEDAYDRWANSDGVVSKFLYDTVNEFYITFQALNPFKKNEEIRSVAGYGVNRNEIVDAGALTIGSLVPIGNSGKAARYGLRQYVVYTSKPHERLLSQDIAHRAATFFRKEIITSGKVGFKNYKTIYFNYTVGNRKFSIGVNPWNRKIFHEGPGTFK